MLTTEQVNWLAGLPLAEGQANRLAVAVALSGLPKGVLMERAGLTLQTYRCMTRRTFGGRYRSVLRISHVLGCAPEVLFPEAV